MSTEKLIRQPLSYEILQAHYAATPGLVADKIKAVLEFVWSVLPQNAVSGIVFAYDEAQNLSDHAAKGQYPMSLLLDVFQSIQTVLCKGSPGPLCSARQALVYILS